MVPVNSSGLLPVYSSGMGCPSALVNGKPALGQELGIPSLLCQLEAGRAFPQGCKAVGDPFLLWVMLVTGIKLLSRGAADSPHPPKASPALPRHRGTPAPPVPGNLLVEFSRGTFCPRRFCFGKPFKAFRARFFFADLVTSALIGEMRSQRSGFVCATTAPPS